MYFNDIHILGYLLIGLIGCVVGQILGLVNERLINHERIFCKGSLKKFKIEYEAHYGFMTLMFIFYAAILYVCGIEKSWHSLIQLAEYKEDLECYNQAYSKINKIKYYSSPSTGIQTLFMQLYMNKIISTANNLLNMLGILYFEPKVQAFIKKYMDRLSFNISIDGNKQLHDSCRLFPNGTGSYDKAIAGVRHYIDVLGGNMGSKMTLAPANIAYTFEAVKGLIDQGYKEINLNCVFEKGWEEKDAITLYYQLKQLSDYILENDLEDELYISMYEENFFKPKDKSDTQNWCGGNGAMISVDWKGDIYPCIRYMESSLGPNVEPIIIGNVNDGIMTNAKCRNCINILKAVNRLNQSTEECINCPIAEGCSWCQAYNYQNSGDLPQEELDLLKALQFPIE